MREGTATHDLVGDVDQESSEFCSGVDGACNDAASCKARRGDQTSGRKDATDAVGFEAEAQDPKRVASSCGVARQGIMGDMVEGLDEVEQDAGP